MAILVVAAVPRFLGLGWWCLWYDEVVPMTLARQPSPSALMKLLDQIEATRAPLHPLLLQGWLRVFGTGDVAGRALSALFGMATVALIYEVGRRLFDRPTGLWAAWLAAICPPLVQYSREAKMYGLLVFEACAAWAILLAFRDGLSRGKAVGLALALFALAYTQPLGLLMIAALFLAACVERPRAVAIFVVAGITVLPWIRHYLDHDPEFLVGRPTLKMLLGLPIGYVGGDSRVLLACLALIGFGLVKSTGRAIVPLCLWFFVPPLLLFGYSLVRHPIFGPARYTLYVAPAYLILLARGLAKLPPIPRGLVAVPLSCLMIATLLSTCFDRDQKADWRAAAAYLREADPDATVVVLSSDRERCLEAVTAAYYLAKPFTVIPGTDERLDGRDFPRRFWASSGIRRGMQEIAFPARIGEANSTPREPVVFRGLRIQEYRPIR